MLRKQVSRPVDGVDSPSWPPGQSKSSELEERPGHGEVGGQAVDIEIHAREILRQRHLVDEILARHTGQPLEKISRDTDRDFILTAGQAKDYGVVDEVFSSRTLPTSPRSGLPGDQKPTARPTPRKCVLTPPIPSSLSAREAGLDLASEHGELMPEHGVLHPQRGNR
jgi:hypothetical protein